MCTCCTRGIIRLHLTPIMFAMNMCDEHTCSVCIHTWGTAWILSEGGGHCGWPARRMVGQGSLRWSVPWWRCALEAERFLRPLPWRPVLFERSALQLDSSPEDFWVLQWTGAFSERLPCLVILNASCHNEQTRRQSTFDATPFQKKGQHFLIWFGFIKYLGQSFLLPKLSFPTTPCLTTRLIQRPPLIRCDLFWRNCCVEEL